MSSSLIKSLKRKKEKRIRTSVKTSMRSPSPIFRLKIS